MFAGKGDTRVSSRHAIAGAIFFYTRPGRFQAEAFDFFPAGQVGGSTQRHRLTASPEPARDQKDINFILE
jgi:hypothetical protein